MKYPDIEEHLANHELDLNGFGRDHIRKMFNADPHHCSLIDPIEEWLDIEWWLKQNEFAHSMTGGYCTAWTTKIGDRLIMITDLSGLDTPAFKDNYCSVGVYDREGCVLDCCDYYLKDLMEDWS